MDQLLDILGGSPALQHLELEDFYLGYEGDEFDFDGEVPDSERSILQLPNLQFLSLGQCSSGAFLARINAQATANVALIANDPFIIYEGDVEVLDPRLRNPRFPITLRASQTSAGSGRPL